MSLSSFFGGEEENTSALSLSRIFEEEPVSLDIFIKDKKFLGLGNINLSFEQSNAVRHIERIYYPALYPRMAEEFDNSYWGDPIPMRNLITLQWGKGSGKDAVARWASLRVAYLLLCLKSPQEYFEMPDNDSIHLLNIAANSAQAHRAFFKPMTKAVERGWFKDKSETKEGVIQYDKGVEAVSGHSDAESQEGLNLMLGVADEIDAFRSKDEMVGQGKRAREASTSAESILEMLKTSASTRFPETYKRVAISYPRYLGSTIQRLTAEGVASNKRYGEKSQHFVSGPFATWDINPRVKGKHQYQEDYDQDPEAAAGKYECKPSRSTDAYFRHTEIFKQAVTSVEQPIKVDYRITEVRSPTTGKTTSGWEPVFIFADDFRPIEGARYAMHGDLAIKGDRAGIAMSHIVKYEERSDLVETADGEHVTMTNVVPIIKNDFTICFEADISAKPHAREIQIRWARMLAFELIKRGFLISRFTFDGFQSSDTIQILTRHGIESMRVSCDINDNVWKNLKDVASEGRLQMPFEQLLMNELSALSRINNKVDHPPGGSKDLADAFAASIQGAIETGGEEDADGTQVDVGASFFGVGTAITPLAGTNEVIDSFGSPFGLPLGMKGMSVHG